MRSYFFLPAFVALTVATSAFDVSIADAIDTPQNVTIPSSVTSENVTYDADSAAASVETAVFTSDDTIDLANSTTNSTSTLTRRSNCAAQPLGYGPKPSTDSASAFLSYSAYASAASSAPVPPGYTQAFKNLQASNNAYNYMGFTNLNSYSSTNCAAKCNAISGCVAFNIYFERNPTVAPGAGCENPSSTVNIKCVFWGGPVSSANANNVGETRGQFQVVIAGSNGYLTSAVASVDGYSTPTYYGARAIDAPLDCNGKGTSLGSQMFTGVPFDAKLCAAACKAQSALNAGSATNTGTCKYFNTYMVLRNGIPIGQMCDLYSQTWSSSYATYTGTTSGWSKYTFSWSYGYSDSADPGTCTKAVTSTWSTKSATSTSTQVATAVATTTGGFLNWTTWEPEGVNLGGWLEKELNYDNVWWESLVNATEVQDEWTLCETLGDRCGPELEARYASYVTTADIDKIASVGVNTLRIPTTYAAWIELPGTQLYHGSQKAWLKKIAMYAIETYGMHVIIGLHSLPGGVNSLDIGEAYGHDAWFQNETNLEYSYQCIEGILDFIKDSGNLTAWTIAPINEASDSIAGFGTAAGLTDSGAAWVNKYMHGVLERIAAVDKRIPMMVQVCFKSPGFWAAEFNSTDNVVLDDHIYYYTNSGVYAKYVSFAVCAAAESIAAEQDAFPVFIGEWNTAVEYNNTLSGRQYIFNLQRYAFKKNFRGSAFWNIHSFDFTTAESGEGYFADYWSFTTLIDDGVVTKENGTAYC